ncbi:hypothetical protein [Novosphingobium resinovorum]|uniref:hypothetical protein n=1 Tax=Novosphingobium resinovorum TaxID=158500 RepID=UPI0012DFA511|nr:hypothetical protein [Novosphingobium resinovorum]
MNLWKAGTARKSFDSGRNSTGMCAFHVDCPLRVASDDPGNLLTNAARLDAFAIKIQPQFAANVCQFTVKMADSHTIQGLEQELAAPDGFLKAKLVISWLT